MKVFISWSGDKSKCIAEIYRRWFPSVIQAVKPYFSPDDVTKGARWAQDISKELETSRIGLLIVTPQNQEAPWLLFEAGALAKNLDRSKVCPILFGGLDPTDVKGPLVQFQAAPFGKDEMKRVVKMINGELGEASLPSEVLEGVFEMWWPKLEQQVIAEIQKKDSNDGDAKRSDRDLLEEILMLTRRGMVPRGLDSMHPVWEDLVEAALLVLKSPATRHLDDQSAKAFRRLLRPLDYILKRKGFGGERLDGLRTAILEAEVLLTDSTTSDMLASHANS